MHSDILGVQNWKKGKRAKLAYIYTTFIYVIIEIFKFDRIDIYGARIMNIFFMVDQLNNDY